MRARETFNENVFEEIKYGFELLIEEVKMQPEVYDMLNIVGVVLVSLILLYTVGKILLFHKASEPIIYALIPIVDVWILHKLAWGSGMTFFISLIPGLGILFLWLTVIVLCARFNGGALAYILSMMFPPLGIFILGITGKFSEGKNGFSIQYTKPYEIEPHVSYDSNTVSQSNDTIKDEFQTKYDEVWGDILKK